MQYKQKVTKGYVLKFSNASGRPNKLAQGITRHFERNASIGKELSNEDARKLSVYGTLDHLAGCRFSFYIKSIKKDHPTDPGYQKTVIVLNESGKSKLRHLRIMRSKHIQS